MKILISTSFYAPYISGLTLAVQRIAEGLAAHGHQVAVLTSRHDDTLPLEEQLNKVRVCRVPVTFWVGKGAVALKFPLLAHRAINDADILLVTLPGSPIDGLAFSAEALLQRKPLLALHFCDLALPRGPVQALVACSNAIVARVSRAIITMTKDYASASDFLTRFSSKLTFIPPIIFSPKSDPQRMVEVRERLSPNGEKVIGFCGRVSSEKGLDTLVAAMPLVRNVFANSQVVVCGGFSEVLGESRYQQKLLEKIEQTGIPWEFLGQLPSYSLAAFYSACDVLVLPSTNQTEAFGMVQVEAMMCGTPVVASNLPGIRVPIQEFGMGALFPSGDPSALAAALIKILSNPKQTDPNQDFSRFSKAKIIPELDQIIRKFYD